MDMESKSLLMETFIRDSIKGEDSMVEENICGRMVHHIKGSLDKVWDMDKVPGNLQIEMEISTLAVIAKIKNVVMVDTFGQMVVYMKAFLKMILSIFYS